MDTERTRGVADRAAVHAALGDSQRLAVVDRLAVGDHSPAELSSALGIPSNLLAHHLRVLAEAGLVTRHRSEGDRRRTYVRLAPSAWPPSPATLPLDAPAPARVVFVCTANTARSHLAAALWRDASRLPSTSAGTHPGARVHRGALATARRHRLRLPQVRPRHLDETLDDDDLVITVCDRAHEEVGDLAWAHWSVPDPVADGSDAAFDRAHDRLLERVRDLAPRLPGAPHAGPGTGAAAG